MPADELPCIGQLEATPDILRGLMASIDEADDCGSTASSRKTCPNWSRTTPMHLELYRDADPEDAFDHFEEQRENNVDHLRELPAEAGNRKALHKTAGEITLNQMLHEWALHDLGHIRQVAELVRARKFLAGAGPLGEDYRLKP